MRICFIKHWIAPDFANKSCVFRWPPARPVREALVPSLHRRGPYQIPITASSALCTSLGISTSIGFHEIAISMVLGGSSRPEIRRTRAAAVLIITFPGQSKRQLVD
ncbi:hypothetical protein V8C43DRAFT_268653 [Trichoderma afarasin]